MTGTQGATLPSAIAIASELKGCLLAPGPELVVMTRVCPVDSRPGSSVKVAAPLPTLIRLVDLPRARAGVKRGSRHVLPGGR